MTETRFRPTTVEVDLDAVTAATASATVHGLAAAVSPYQAGLVASDVIAELPGALS